MKKYWLLIIACFNFPIILNAQILETRYLNNDYAKTTKDSAAYRRIINWVNKEKKACSIKDYFIATNMLSYEAQYSNYDSSKQIGVSIAYDDSTGNRINKFFYDKQNRNYRFIQYHKNGKLKRDEKYTFSPISGFIESTTGILQNEKGEKLPFEPYEQMPEYTGGENKLMEYLSSNINYPKDAIAENITGRVLVDFTVCEDGQLCDLEIRKSVSSSIDKEVLRVVKAMPKWKPGKQDGELVKVKYTLPVLFTLESNRAERKRLRKERRLKNKSK